MKPGATLLIPPAAIVDEQALARALDAGQPAGGARTMPQEPLAGFAPRPRERHHHAAHELLLGKSLLELQRKAAEVAAFSTGKAPRNPVNPVGSSRAALSGPPRRG
jgi:hypothetical protein